MSKEYEVTVVVPHDHKILIVPKNESTQPKTPIAQPEMATTPVAENFNEEASVNLGVVGIDTEFENGTLKVTVKILGQEIGTANLGLNNNCVELKGSVSGFGVASAKVKLSVCADFSANKVCVSGKAYIKVLGQKITLANFSECASF
ncbi:hypothetical protein MOC96_00225 [Bacillus vallismortis]|uniref:hypothetical protein n=1 Tax=Bacillus vallismortis TaxID=72361 RepID=UPI00227E78C9|nr:hypothetical protein [Bacillus vallismortis]MCY8307180.1 hypothetical protein [Bacillus vallismortis]